MNPLTRAILQSILSTDVDLTDPEDKALRQILSGNSAVADDPNPYLLLTQKQAARQLSVSRMTLWRLTKRGILRPVEITPGTWRYRYSEISDFAGTGWHRRKPANTLGAKRQKGSEVFDRARTRNGAAEESSIQSKNWKPP
jgi:hypothetical protein